jgi:alpha-2-macroglobulin
MKLMIFIISLLSTTPLLAKVFFQPMLDHRAAHELSWNFDRPVLNWGKTESDQVTLTCEKSEIKNFSLHWSNAQTLKLTFPENLNPGTQCEVTLNLETQKSKNTFQVPLLKIAVARPYDLYNLPEDSAFILLPEAPLDPELLAKIAYVEVVDMSEKVEFDAVTGDLRAQVLKESALEQEPNAIVLKPRRLFPFEKSFALRIPEKYTFALKEEGKIRSNFKLTVGCERPKASAPCSPLSKIRVEFSSEVDVAELKKIKLNLGKTSSSLKIPENGSGTSFEFIAKLEPEAEYRVSLDGDLKDQDGRSLSNKSKFPLTIKTGSFPPLAKFPGAFGILESQADPIMPVSVRNVEKSVTLKKSSAVISLNDPKIFMSWLDAIEKRQNGGYDQKTELRHRSVFEGSKIKLQTQGLTYSASKNEIEVLGLPLKQKGLHLLELSSPTVAEALLDNQKSFFTSTAVLVTNLAAHLKLGETNSLVWVTTFDKAQAVPGAEVKIYNCKGEMVESGKTNKEGFILFSKTNLHTAECVGKLDNLNSKLLVVAKVSDDATFTLSSWNEGIEPWRFGVPYYYGGDQFKSAHTVFDRPIYKVNEVVHMLHLLREQGTNGLISPAKKYSHLSIVHSDTQKKWTLPLKWKDLGSSHSEFTVPQNAPQGTYYLSLVNLDKKSHLETNSVAAGSFIVKEFRVPLMRSEVHFQNKQQSFLQGQEMKIIGHLDYLAGGVSSMTPVTMRAQLSEKWDTSVKEYEEYVFDSSGLNSAERMETQILEKKTTKTNEHGDFDFALKVEKKSPRAFQLLVEVEFLDPNGVFQTNSTMTSIYPQENLVGVKSPGRVDSKKAAEFNLVVINQKHQPLKNQKYKATLHKRSYLTTRKKIIGGFYTYDTTEKLEDLGEVCQGKTNSQGLASCQVKVEKAGQYVLLFNADDSLGVTSFYSYGDDYEWGEQEYNDRLSIIADKRTYEPGQVAKLEMKLPFETGTVLITKERGGIKSVTLANYDRKNPFISLPIEKNDFPNFFVSALVVRGRLASPGETGLVDLSKPAYKLGLQEIQVERRDQNLKITLTPEKEKYQVRDRVKVKIKVETQDQTPMTLTKVALSVFDEGLLLLNNQNSFDAARSLIQSFAHGVTTSTAQSHIIGKRHFGLKARPHGGGGGKDLKPRELFDTLIYWNPGIALDKKGEASVEFKLNDSLTSFKIYGLAYSQDKFGNQNTRVIATQDIMTFVGTSPGVRTGDEFQASYTLKNMTSEEHKLRGELFLNNQKIKEESFLLKASESHRFTTVIKPFENAGSAIYLLNLYEGSKKIDSIKTMQKISPLQIPRVKFSDLKEVKSPLAVPGNTSDKNLAGTEVLLSSRLAPTLDSLQGFMKDYAYNCLEQQLARALILEDSKLLNKILNNLSSYQDSRSFLKFYPSRYSRGSILLTLHFLEVAHWNKISVPKEDNIQSQLSIFINGAQKDLDDWEKTKFQALRLKAMTTLKLIKSPYYSAKWEKEVQAPAPNESMAQLLDKWVIFYPGPEALETQRLIREKLHIEGSTVTLNAQGVDPEFFLTSSPSTLFGRFLILQKTLPLASEFSTFYSENEGKFIRGFLSTRNRGEFLETTSNTYAYLLQKMWPSSPVTGTTKISGHSTVWKKNEAPPIFLKFQEAMKDQTLKHEGSGVPWADIRTLSFGNKEARTSQGIEVSMKLMTLETHETHQVQDRLKARITVIARKDIQMGALFLPLPAGITILETSSTLAMNFEERSEDLWRGYFDVVPKGTHEIDVTFRLNQAGSFEMPGARMEAMYSPEVFGEIPYWKIKIQ